MYGYMYKLYVNPTLRPVTDSELHHVQSARVQGNRLELVSDLVRTGAREIKRDVRLRAP
jgi:hypothetical protein